MTTTPEPEAPWEVLAAHLSAPGSDEITVTSYADLPLGEGRFYAYGQWREDTHRLTVQLHPWGIGNIREPRGCAHCTCEFWNDDNWKTARTPRLLPYPDLAAWIAGHAAAAGSTVHKVADLMAGVRVLAALHTDPA
jgi:hypothetical protein